MATGPSLTPDVVEYVRPFHASGQVKVLGCNDAYRACDFLDLHYACDPRWWDHHWPFVKDYPAPLWTQDRGVARKRKINWVEGRGGKGINTKGGVIHFGANSGFQLLNLAFLCGNPDRLILLGYNMTILPGKPHHFFGNHPKGLSQASNYRGFVSSYRMIQPEYVKKIVNCTEPTAIPNLPRMPLEEALHGGI